MRAVSMFTALSLIACASGPTPEDVAGTYDLHPTEGAFVEEVAGEYDLLRPDDDLPEDLKDLFDQIVIQLRRDGTYSHIIPEGIFESGEVTATGPYSVSRREDGCFEALLGPREISGEGQIGTICGDTLTYRGGVLIRRR